MSRTIFLVSGFVLLAARLPAAEFVAHRDLPYAQPANERQTLDVYSPGEGRNHPVAIWIHGGGWTTGSKQEVFHKPQAFTSRGYVLVSINYRLQPSLKLEEIPRDVAQAIRWVYDHARDYGGDPQRIIVMGHSAGGQLAALVATDESYLKAEGLSLANLMACVPVDGRYWMGQGRETVSPAEHVGKGKPLPAFLVLHAAKTPNEAQKFVKLLQDAGANARTLPAEGKDHTTINEHIGKPGEAITDALFNFLDTVIKK